MADYIYAELSEIKEKISNVPNDYLLDAVFTKKRLLTDNSILNIDGGKFWSKNGEIKSIEDLRAEKMHLESILKNEKYNFESKIVEELIVVNMLLLSVKQSEGFL